MDYSTGSARSLQRQPGNGGSPREAGKAYALAVLARRHPTAHPRPGEDRRGQHSWRMGPLSTVHPQPPAAQPRRGGPGVMLQAPASSGAGSRTAATVAGVHLSPPHHPRCKASAFSTAPASAPGFSQPSWLQTTLPRSASPARRRHPPPGRKHRPPPRSPPGCSAGLRPRRSSHPSQDRAVAEERPRQARTGRAPAMQVQAPPGLGAGYGFPPGRRTRGPRSGTGPRHRTHLTRDRPVRILASGRPSPRPGRSHRRRWPPGGTTAARLYGFKFPAASCCGRTEAGCTGRSGIGSIAGSLCAQAQNSWKKAYPMVAIIPSRMTMPPQT